MTPLHHYGWHSDHQLYLMGDCIVADCERGKPSFFVFPDTEGRFHFGGEIFVKAENLEGHSAPKLFPGAQNPAEEYGRINWQRERWVVEEIFVEVLTDFRRILTPGAGDAAVAGMLQYLIMPESMKLFGCKPGLWITGEKATGKTTTVRNLMRILGESQTNPIFPGSTDAGLQRTLGSTCNLPVHFDEWRNEAVTAGQEDIIRHAYNAASIPKGSSDAGSQIIDNTPLTVPIITGLDTTTDPALRSRFLILGITPPTTSADQQARRLDHLEAAQRAAHYHRLGRFLLRLRPNMAQEFHRACRDIVFQVHNAGSRKATTAMILLATMYAAYQVIFRDDNPANRDRILGIFQEWITARILEQDAA